MEIVILILAILITTIIMIPVMIAKKNFDKKRPIIIQELTKIFDAYKFVNLGMSETVMLNTMNFRYDKTLTQENTIYRFVYVTKGSSGNISGSFYGATNMNSTGINQYGSLKGSQESHDESVVIIKCKDNRVIEVSPYNMNNIVIPSNFGDLEKFASSFGIKV